MRILSNAFFSSADSEINHIIKILTNISLNALAYFIGIQVGQTDDGLLWLNQIFFSAMAQISYAVRHIKPACGMRSKDCRVYPLDTNSRLNYVCTPDISSLQIFSKLILDLLKNFDYFSDSLYYFGSINIVRNLSNCRGCSRE